MNLLELFHLAVTPEKTMGMKFPRAPPPPAAPTMGEVAMVAQFSGPRLPEGATVKFLCVLGSPVACC